MQAKVQSVYTCTGEHCDFKIAITIWKKRLAIGRISSNLPPRPSPINMRKYVKAYRKHIKACEMLKLRV